MKKIQKRNEDVMEQSSKCNLCPRKCNVDRSNAIGFCQANDKIYVARAALHYWEEPCISGSEGSGAIFFSGCNLRCVYCQNHFISRKMHGSEVSVSQLVDLFFDLKQQGANNINLVTPTHYIPQIVLAIIEAKRSGLSLPIVYNTSSYENVESLKMLEGLVDVYLPDLKYVSSDLASKYSGAPDYPLTAKAAIEEMFRQVGKPVFYENKINSGVIVRHLCLPGHTKESKAVIKYLYETYGNNIYISIMNQYTPINKCKYDNLNRKVTDKEYDSVIEYALELGIKNAFVQEGEAASESFIPQFNKKIV